MKFTSSKRKLWITVFTIQEQILSPNVRHCKNTPIKCVNLFKVNWRLARCFSRILSTMHKKRNFLLRISSINVTKFCKKHLIKQSLTGNFIFFVQCNCLIWEKQNGEVALEKGCFYFWKMLANLTPFFSLSFSTPLVFLSFLEPQFIVISQRRLNRELLFLYRNSVKYMKCLVTWPSLKFHKSSTSRRPEVREGGKL